MNDEKGRPTTYWGGAVEAEPLCRYDGKPCPPPLAGKGNAASRCALNGICQRVDMSKLPTFKLSIEAGASDTPRTALEGLVTRLRIYEKDPVLGPMCSALFKEASDELAAVTAERDALKQSILDCSHPNMRLLLEDKQRAEAECAALRKNAEIQVGHYSLSPGHRPNQTWIEHESGEGGDFDTADIETVIAMFYAKNF